MDKFGGHRTEVKERIDIRERLALRNKVKEEEHLEIYGGLREEIGMKTYLHGPIDYIRENAETAISCRGPGPARKKRTSSREEKEYTDVPLGQNSTW